MVTCELCGESSNNLVLTRIAGTNVKVCIKCSSLGKNIEPNLNKEHIFRHRLKEEEVKLQVVNNYSQLITNSMQKKGLDIHILARGTNIRESTLSKYVTNKMKPDIESARKIEKFLNVKLIEEFKNEIYEDKLRGRKEM